MAEYYYFVAQLPTLRPDDNLPLTLEGFLSQAAQFLSPGDYQRLHDALFGDPLKVKDRRGVAGAWIDFNHRFRNELAFYRATRAKKDPSLYLRGDRRPDFYITQLIEEAARAENPLAAEKILDKARWHYLEEMLLGHFFDFEVVLIYGLKLKMMERYQFVDSDEGRAIFEEYKNFDPNQIAFLASK